MQIITLILAALFVYLLFSRKGGMGMGCCGSHGSHSDHGNEVVKDKYFNELSEDGNEDVIDLREDQYTVVTVEEDKQQKTIDRIAS
jgi:hypothetical protein